MLTSHSLIYSQKNEPNWTDVTVICVIIVLITRINRCHHFQWSASVSWISTAEGFAVMKIFFHEYRNLTWILTFMTLLHHHSYPIDGIVTWKWDFIAVFFKSFLIVVWLYNKIYQDMHKINTLNVQLSCALILKKKRNLSVRLIKSAT